MIDSTKANARLDTIRTLPHRYLRELEHKMAEQQRELGRRIRDAREAKGWLQKDLARACHVEPVTVSRWERGVTAPDLNTIERIAAALDQPITYLVSSTRTPAAALDEAAVRQMVREEVEGAIADVEKMLRRLLRQEPPGPPRASGGET